MELRPGLLALEFRVVDPTELEPHHRLRRGELRRLLQDFLRFLPALELRERRPELVEYRRVGTLRRAARALENGDGLLDAILPRERDPEVVARAGVLRVLRYQLPEHSLRRRRFRSSRKRLPRSRRLMASWKNRAATRARV